MARLTPEGQLLHDVSVKFQVYLERLKAGEVRKMDSAIRGLDAAVRAALERMGDAPSRAVLNRELASLRVEMLSVIQTNTREYMRTLELFSRYATQFEVSTIGLLSIPGSPVLTPARAAVWATTLANPIQATGQLMEPFVATWGIRAIAKIEGAIRVGFAQGLTTAEIVRLIRGTRANKFRDGILGNVIRREAAAMVRTSLQHVSNQARQATYADNSDIVEGYIWISTLDSRTTTVCKSLDGREFKLNHGPVPPIHINCRSTTIPKIKGVNILTSNVLRAAEGGAVGADLTYYEWLKLQSEEFQNHALGKTRAILFRDGGLSAEQFARLNLDKNFQPLTLDEMRELNPPAFRRAGL